MYVQAIHERFESLKIDPVFGQVLHPSGQGVVNVYIQGLYKNYPLEPCIAKTLQLFVDKKKPEKIVWGYPFNAQFKCSSYCGCHRQEEFLHHALYIPLLHGLLNGECATNAGSLR